MHPILLVAERDFEYYLSKPSFVLVTLFVPVIVLSFTVLLDWVPATGTGLQGDLLDPAGSYPVQRGVIGLVDRSHLINRIPAFLQPLVRPYEGVVEAEEALRAGRITAYYIVSESYLQTGEVERVTPTFEPIPGRSEVMELLLIANLIGEEDPLRLRTWRQPVHPERLEHETVSFRKSGLREGVNDDAIRQIGYFLAFVMYSTTFMAAGYLLRSVTTEKENRVMELILTSIRPVDLLAGKLLGLGLLALLQFLIWAMLGFLAIERFAVGLPLAELGIGGSLALMMVLYAFLGYAIFATLMAGIGALAPTAREIAPLSILVVLPAMIPLALLHELLADPHSVLAVVLSIIPFTAPVAMVMRYAQSEVPLWQIVVSLSTSILVIPLLLSITARLFRAKMLLASDLQFYRLWQVLRE